ncbi:hypothetical protein Cyrtocomes_01004 [Candidatus Cyrtobacter comes]|uniref:Apea-like HEPN domain-containing protein n=1 Tax=Candidatus Cyrtobacter comes TaxID=675776 RepID=A0ABU5L914_9RICK|nr:hypothetical protein [Candidatus Cyrtobacter comes]MDZ5762613.1 hypothetical protein [Candidatus Cyrtobacter comes]
MGKYILSQKENFPKGRKDLYELAIKHFLQRDFISSVHIGIAQLEFLLRDYICRKGRVDKKITKNLRDLHGIISMIEKEKYLEESKRFTIKYLFVGLKIRNKLYHGQVTDEQFQKDNSLTNHYVYICWVIIVFLQKTIG